MHVLLVRIRADIEPFKAAMQQVADQMNRAADVFRDRFLAAMVAAGQAMDVPR